MTVLRRSCGTEKSSPQRRKSGSRARNTIRGFPRTRSHTVFCRKASRLSDVDFVAFYDKPFLKFERLLETYVAFAPRGLRSFSMAIPLWVREKLFQKSLLHDELKQFSKDFDWEHRLLFAEHHQSHAASAFYPSPFEDALILTMDGVGEWATTSVALGSGNHLEIIKEIHFPHSLGLLYSAFTYYTGFKVNSGEYKVMGLAPYGSPRFAKQILDHLIDLKADGSFRLNLDYFDYCTGLDDDQQQVRSPLRRAAAQAGGTSHAKAYGPRRIRAGCSGGSRLAHDAFHAARRARKNLCLAGGVALNCVANGRLLRDRQFEKIWIQPAAGDAGGSLGAALAAYYSFKDQPRKVNRCGDQMKGSYLGPEFSQVDIEQRLTSAARSSRSSAIASFWMLARVQSKPKKRSVGFKDEWSLVHAHSVAARFWVTLVPPKCNRCSISK